MLAAAHLLRYGEGPEVAENLRGVGEISWLVFLRDRDDAAAELLSRVQEDLASWPVTRLRAHAAGLPKMPPCPASPKPGPTSPRRWPPQATNPRTRGTAKRSTADRSTATDLWKNRPCPV